jgi:hypothetical protein
MMSTHNLLEFLGRFWWVFVPFPPLVWLALRPVVRRWERCRNDPAYARATSAWRRYRRTAWRDEDSAWRNYLADRLGLCAEALTADSVTEALRERDVDATLIADARRRFEEKDAADYGRRPAVSSQGAHRLVRRLQKATVPLLLLIGFCFRWTPLRRIVPTNCSLGRCRCVGRDLTKRSRCLSRRHFSLSLVERFLNAGNSWFFAGASGRALANYRAAERRAPFDRQLRESVEFLRANRADAFPPPTAPTGKLATACGTAFARGMPFVEGRIFRARVFDCLDRVSDGSTDRPTRPSRRLGRAACGSHRTVGHR